MPHGSLPNCQDFQKRMDLFLDGEVDGRTMRELALHVARCASCESGLREAERVQDVFTAAVHVEVDRVDVASLWRSIEARLDTPHLSLLGRLSLLGWLGERWKLRAGFEFPALAVGAAAAVALVVGAALWSESRAPVPAAVVASNQADIDRLSSSASSVAVWTEPRQNTTAIWVSYEP